MAEIMWHQMTGWTQNKELKSCGWKWLWPHWSYCHGICLERHVQNRRKVCLQAKICSWTSWIISGNANHMTTMCDSVLFTIVSLTGIYAWAWSIILQVGLWPCECFSLKNAWSGVTHAPLVYFIFHWIYLFILSFIYIYLFIHLHIFIYSFIYMYLFGH